MARNAARPVSRPRKKYRSGWCQLMFSFRATRAPKGRKSGSAETPQRGLRQLAAPEELRRAAGRFVSRRNPVRDLLLRAKHLFVAAIVPGPTFLRAATRHARRTPVELLRGERDQLGLSRLGTVMPGSRLSARFAGGCGGSCVGRAASFRDSREACYFFPRGGGQADRVRAVDLAANNVGLPLDVLRPAGCCAARRAGRRRRSRRRRRRRDVLYPGREAHQSRASSLAASFTMSAAGARTSR
jgi:hypothetical protein